MPLVYVEHVGFEFAPAAIEPDPISFLRSFGYAAASASRLTEGDDEEALQSMPTIGLSVRSHIEVHDHTWYVLECSLLCPQPAAAKPTERRWRAKRRLQHLRASLHNPVRQQLEGHIYSEHFGAAPFASYGGLPGTTARLDAWLASLASCINAAACPPSLLAQVLQFLEPPAAPGVGDAEPSDYTEFARVAGQVKVAPGTPDMTEPCTAGATEHCSRDPELGTSRWFWWLVPDLH